MNVNDLVDALGLPRYSAARLPAGSSIVATINENGSVTVTIHPAPSDESSVLPVTEQNDNVQIKRGPGRPRKITSE
jgi:hypothetical protein